MVTASTRTKPTAAELAAWSAGSRTVRQAVKETGLSRQVLFSLMRDGTIRYRVADLKRTRLLNWADVVRYLASLPGGELK
jgi:hypothetical protein